MNILILTVIALAATTQAAIDRSKVRPVFQTVMPKIPAIAPKVVGGREAAVGERPFQCTVVSAGGFCGGSLIGPSLVLTAAHCVDGINSATVTLGAHRVFEEEETQQEIDSRKITVHPEWDRFNLNNDIALVHLSRKAELNDRVSIIKWNRDRTISLPGKTCTVSGWGRFSDNSGSLSSYLRIGETTVMTNSDCARYFGSYITDKHMCGDGSRGVGSCNGDSGGPNTIVHDGHTVQVGIVSFGSGAGCQKGYPSVYTNPAYHDEWIDENSDN